MSTVSSQVKDDIQKRMEENREGIQETIGVEIEVEIETEIEAGINDKRKGNLKVTTEKNKKEKSREEIHEIIENNKTENLQENAIDSSKNDIDVTKHTGLVKRIAHHLMMRLPNCVQFEDLMQAGMIGLILALKHYDDSKGASFETYASIRIRGAMLDEIRKGDWAPRSVYRNTRRISKVVREIEQATGRDPRDSEIAEKLNVTLDAYHQMVQDISNIRVYSFPDVGLPEDAFSESITGSATEPLEGLQQEDLRFNLEKCLALLPEKEQLVLTLYYHEDLNLREVGSILGVSESRISQIHSQAMTRLQQKMREWRNSI